MSARPVKTLKAGPVKRISVNGALLRQAQANGRRAKKPYTIFVGTGTKMRRLRARWIGGSGLYAFVYKPHQPLPTNAVVWMQTKGRLLYL